MASGTVLAKFGCYVARWKEHKDGRWESWEEHLAFRAAPALEHSDEVWEVAKAAAAKKWKQTMKSGWEIRELWMEAPRNW
jgi:hypothetical protein